jgi:hypothetical protein
LNEPKNKKHKSRYSRTPHTASKYRYGKSLPLASFGFEPSFANQRNAVFRAADSAALSVFCYLSTQISPSPKVEREEVCRLLVRRFSVAESVRQVVVISREEGKRLDKVVVMLGAMWAGHAVAVVAVKVEPVLRVEHQVAATGAG